MRKKSRAARAFLEVALVLWVACLASGRASAASSEDPARIILDATSETFFHARGARRIVPLLELTRAREVPFEDTLFDGGEALLQFLRRAIVAADGPTGDPLVAARARFELAKLLDRHGDWAAAEALRAQLGFVGETALLVGPFDNDAGASLPADTALPAEQAVVSGQISAASSWPGGNTTTARVRPLPSAKAAGLAEGHRLGGGGLPLGALVRPETHVAVYLVFAVRTEVGRAAALRLGSTGAVEVWLNGRRVGGHTGDRPLTLDADAYAAPLQRGENRFVVRLAVGDGTPELILRLTDPAGRALKDLAVADPTHVASAARSGAASNPVHSLRAALDAGARRDPAAALDRDAYLILDEVDGPTPDEACARRRSSAGSARDAALEHELRLACVTDGDMRRRVLEARLETIERAANPRSVPSPTLEKIWLHTRLAELALRGRTPQRGEDHLRAAIALGGPTLAWRARLRLAELDSDRGLGSLAASTLAELVEVAPARRVREAQAQLALRGGRRDEAERRYAALSAELPGDVALRRQWVSLERGRGQAEAMAHARTRVEHSTDLRDVEADTIDRTEIDEGLGRIDEAAAGLRALLTLVPDDARLEERLGKLLLGHARKDEALKHLARALQLRPQNPELRGLLNDVDPSRAGGSDLWRRWRVDVTKIRERALANKLGRGDPARILYDGATVRVHPNGLEETLVERVIEIGDRRGAEQQAELDIRYAPDSQSVEVRVARVYKATGEIVEAATIEERDLSEPWYGLYYDVRAQAIGLAGLEPGDVIHLAYTVSDQGRRNELGESFCDLRMLQEDAVRLESVYRLIAPRSRTIHFNRPRLDGVGAELPIVTTDDGDERRYEIVARDVAKIQPEQGMPGATELGAYVHASTFADWAEVARFYRTLVRPQLEADADIRRAAHEAVRGKHTVEEKVAAIYDLVVRSTRYVALEFGVHGYQPYKVSQIFSRRFGDCKDKASLLVVMLREIGIEASLVLLRTRREGDVAPSPASFAPFDHAIAYVPALDRYLDGTAEFSGAAELPAEDQGVAVLHVDEGALKRTPVSGPAGAEMEARLEVLLAKDGSAEVEDHRVVRGQAAEAWRRHYQAAGERKERFEKLWARRSPGAEVRSIELPHLEERERPVEAHAKLRLPRLARPDGSALALPLLLREPQLLTAFGRLSVRSHDLELPQAMTEVERVRVRLPEGMRAHMPEPATVESPFGSFTLKAEASARGDEIVVEARTVLATRRIAKADYTAFRAFLAAIDRAVAGELRLEATR